MKLDTLKQASQQTAYWMMKISGERKKAERQLNCANQLEYALEKGTLNLYLNHANFCNNRSCSICNGRKSTKRRIKVIPGVRRFLEDNLDLKPILLTLTVRNCNQSDLRWTITRLMQPAWGRFHRAKWFPGVACLKSLEVTRPKDCFYHGRYIGRMGDKQIEKLCKSGLINFRYWHQFFSEECHPHYHVLMFVHDSYFLQENYINQIDWVYQWKKALRVDYLPILDIRRIYSDEHDGAIITPCLEVTKYALKPFDVTDRMAPLIFRQLHGLRLNSVSGELRRYVNEGELARIEQTGISGNEIHQDGAKLTYEWDGTVDGYMITSLEV